MCDPFGGMTETGQRDTRGSSTTTTQLPDWVTSASKSLLSSAQKQASAPTKSYSGKLTASVNPALKAVFEKFGLLEDPGATPEAIQGAQDYAYAAPQSVGTERVVDESGRLGAISDYMNPYTDAALSPTYRKIKEAADAARLRQRASATSAGAYGDARHGIADAGINESEILANSEATYGAFKDAFDMAMGLRTGDLGRMFQTDVTNAGFDEQALSRLFQGSGAVLDRAQQGEDQTLQRLQAQLAAGGVEQDLAQSGLDRKYAEFLRKYSGDEGKLSMLSSIMSALPYNRTVKGNETGRTTLSEPDNSGYELLGGIASAALPMVLSDRRTKAEIHRIGDGIDGIPLYRFRYHDDAPDTVRIGFMADDVEKVRPEAVVTRGDGMKMINYAALG